MLKIYSTFVNEGSDKLYPFSSKSDLDYKASRLEKNMLKDYLEGKKIILSSQDSFFKKVFNSLDDMLFFFEKKRIPVTIFEDEEGNAYLEYSSVNDYGEVKYRFEVRTLTNEAHHQIKKSGFKFSTLDLIWDKMSNAVMYNYQFETMLA